MRISLLLLAATLVGGTYYLQTNPDIVLKIRQTFSRDNMLEPKFHRQEDQEKYRQQKTPLFYPESPSGKSS